jgi:hypothetical protein
LQKTNHILTDDCNRFIRKKLRKYMTHKSQTRKILFPYQN